MKRLLVIGIAVVMAMGQAGEARADLFEESINALGAAELNAASLDTVGQALRGGLAAGYPQFTPAPSVFHDFNISTPCGSFTFGTGLIDNLAGMLDPNAMIQGLQSTATNLIGAAISQLPMVTLCYAAPSMCDVVKYLQDMVNEVLQFKGMSCQQAEQLLTGLGGRLSGARTSRCVSAQQRGGMTLTEAETACRGGSSLGITDHASGLDITASGSDGDSKMIEDSLTRVGASQEIKDFARELLGEVEISAGSTAEEPVNVDIEAPEKRVHDAYEIERNTMYAEIEDAVSIVSAGNVLPAPKRQAVSLPGTAMPDAILRGLGELRAVHPAAYQDYLAKLSGTFAMLKLSWKVNETRDLLEEGMLDNTLLSEAEEDIIKARLARLERERDRFIGEKELMERHALPIMREILADYRERQGGAGAAMLASGVGRVLPGSILGIQLPLGYGY